VTEVVKLELIKLVVPAIAAAGAVLATVLGFINRNKIREIKVAINGRMEQLLELAKLQGRMEERGDGAGVASLTLATAAALKDSTALIAEKVKNENRDHA
jgi:hypothetical protein